MLLKNIFIVSIAATFIISGCNKVKRNTGRSYMPDMNYSRAYETYAGLDSSRFTTSMEDLGEGKIFYNAMPVAGSRARGEMAVFPLKGDSAGYNNSKSIKNPLPALTATEYLEAARLYLVNCGICHGPKLDGKGPLYVSGVFIAAPRNFMDAEMKAMAEGTMFHAATYGKGQMGSYASQLNTKQRWMIIHYIKEKQAGTGAQDSTKTKTDSTKIATVSAAPKDPGN